MYVTLVNVRVKPEHIDAFIVATRLYHVSLVKEAGNKRFDVLQNVKAPDLFLIDKAYASAEDALAHNETDHYRVWREAVAEMIAEPPQSVRHKAIVPDS